MRARERWGRGTNPGTRPGPGRLPARPAARPGKQFKSRVRSLVGVARFPGLALLAAALLLAGHGAALGIADAEGAAQDALDAAAEKTGTRDLVAQGGGIVLGNAFSLLEQAQPGHALRAVRALLGA